MYNWRNKQSRCIYGESVSRFSYEQTSVPANKPVRLASRYLYLVWFALWLLSAETVWAKVFLFDMGTAKSELRPGFIRITRQSVYRKTTGYGWKSAAGLREQYQHYSREWQYSESRGRKQPPPLYTNEITCDTILSDQPNSFLVDLEPGDYTVYLLSGLSAGSTREYHDFNVGAGKATAAVQIPGRYRFEKRVLSVSVDGQLIIALHPKTDWLLTSVIIYPTTDEAAVRSAFLDALEREIFFLPPDVAKQWTETPHINDRPAPEFSAQDRARGYALFARHYSEVIYPNTVPRQNELNPVLRTFASLGEYEPVTFTIRPFGNSIQEHRGRSDRLVPRVEGHSGRRHVTRRSVHVEATDLRSDKSSIPASNIDIRSVRYMLVRPNYSSFFSYHVAPDVLEHRDTVDLEPGRNQRFWITIKVPDDARPGVYNGTIRVVMTGAPSAEVLLKLRVLPIRLRKNPEYIYGMYYRDPLSNVSNRNTPDANAYFQKKAERERQDMVDHGMNSHISSVSGLTRDENGHWSMDGSETERRIALDRKYGLADKPLVVSLPVTYWYSRLVDRKGTGSHLRLIQSDVPQTFFDEVTKMVEAVEKAKAKYDWPEFLYYPIDEPGRHEAAVRFMVRVLKAIKRVPGVRTYITADPTHDQFTPMWSYVDVWCCQPFVFDYEKIHQLSQEKGIEFWCYPNHISGENDHTPIRGARMTWGFGFWKSGFRTLIPWIYQADVGDPWNYLDGTSMDFFNRSLPDGEPVPVAMWEAYREGIDDGRYLYTLEQLVKKGKQHSSGQAADAAHEAEKKLKFLWDSIKVQEKYKYDGLWSGKDFDAYRWLLASQIIKLQTALK